MIELLIILLCAQGPIEARPLCQERVTACYEKFIEISDESPAETVRLCYGTYTEGLK